MPELPDITVYIEAVRARVVEQPLEDLRLKTPFLLRTVDPPLSAVVGKRVTGMRRMGKRIVFELEDDPFIVLHLMIAGRLHWKPKSAKAGGRNDLAAFDFPNGSLTLTEAGTKRRASLHIIRGEAGLAEFNRGLLDQSLFGEFNAALVMGVGVDHLNPQRRSGFLGIVRGRELGPVPI